MKNKKKNKKKSIVSGISLKKLPVKINKFYNQYKKKQKINKLKEIKLGDREELKRIIQEQRRCQNEYLSNIRNSPTFPRRPKCGSTDL